MGPSVLIAPDSFKGSASSAKVGALIEQGIRRVAPNCQVRRVAIADGGEGTLDAIVSALDGTMRTVEVSGPLGQRVLAHYGLVEPATAVIEVAESSGIALIETTSENARRASSIGVGQLILAAIDEGVRRIIIGLGGSATSDGGTGMAKALGVRFLDSGGVPVPCGLSGLERLASIDCSRIPRQVRETEFIVLTDVSNCLVGPTGAIHMFGPQKGLKADELEMLDSWMSNYARLLDATAGTDISSRAGSGAAGGLGAALMAFCDARVEHGIDFVLDTIRIDDLLQDTDLVITGEGRMDAQSAFGKAPVGVAAHAKRFGIPVIAIVGSRAANLDEIYDAGIDLVIPITIGPATLEECIANTKALIPIAGEAAIRAFLLDMPPVRHAPANDDILAPAMLAGVGA